jgi:hypothetical protein
MNDYDKSLLRVQIKQDAGLLRVQIKQDAGLLF